MIDTWIRYYCRALTVAMVLCLAVMVILVFGNVVLRYGFNSGLTISEELSRWLFVWMTFMGALVALQDNDHLGTDTLVARLSLRGKKICLALTYLLMLYCCWLLGQGSYVQWLINWDSTSAVMEVSQAWFYASGVLFALSATPLIVLKLVRLLLGRATAAELHGPHSEDSPPHHPQA